MNSLDIAKPPAVTRVVVAMSGGVDSSVTAALLAAEGYDVVGVTLQLYDDRGAANRKGTCCAGRDIADARTVAARLGIPHYVLDYEASLPRQASSRPFTEAYVGGRDADSLRVSCNQHRSNSPISWIRPATSAPMRMATGHYCRVAAT